MKMKSLWTICLGVVMAGTAPAQEPNSPVQAPALVQVPVNLVPNPGVEQVAEQGFATGWSGGEFGKPGSNVTLDKQVAHSGQNSLRLATAPGSFVTSSAAPIKVKPKTNYYISWWCKTQDMEGARAYLFLQTNKAQRVLADADQSLTTDWTQHFSEYVTTEDETTLNPVLTTQHLGKGAGFAWFDDIAVYEGSFPAEILPVYKRFQRNQMGISETATVLSRSPKLTLWADNLAARIYREDGVPDYAGPAQEIKLSGARGEEDYAQVALLPAADLSQVELVGADLKGPGTIPAARVHWWPVGYTNVIKTHWPRTRTGATPDPLLKSEPIDAKANRNTPFVLSVSIPRDAKKGTYRGTVTVQAGGKEIASIPLAVEVFGFALPEDPTFRTLISFTPQAFRPWDKRPLPDIEKDAARVLAAHGVRGGGATVEVPAKLVDGKIVCDFNAFDERMQWFIDNLHFNAFFLGPCFGGGTSEGWQKHRKWLDMEPLSDEFNRYFPEYMRQVGAHLRQKGWMHMAYLYLWDEPEPDYFDKVVALQKLALEGDPGFKIWLTTSPSHQAFWGVVKAWSIPFSRPHYEQASVDRRRAAGDEIWVYNIPASLETSQQIHRLWFWQAARYGAIGAQLWSANFYNKIDPWEDVTPQPYAVGRNRESLYIYDAGEAILIYPDKQGGPPLPSLRLKMLQKGIDDYGYLSILQQRLTAQAKKQKIADPEKYAREEMQRITSILVKDINNYVTDAQLLAATRQKIARRIEALPAVP